MSPVDISAKAPPELELLARHEPLSSRHFAAMALASIAVHIVGGALFLSLPEVVPAPRAPVITSDLHQAVHLYVPRLFEPTQKAPNLNKVVRPELDVRSEREAPQPQAPMMRRPQPAPGPVATPASAPPPVVEPPKIQAAVQPSAPPAIAPPPNPEGSTPQAPPPPATSKPKIAFENVAPPPSIKLHGPPDPRLLMEAAAMERLARTARSPGGGGTTVGDNGDDLTDLPSLNQAQSKGYLGSDLQLLSDPSGFDFGPYLRQILTSVKRNWMSVIPDAVKTGRKGTVLIQFIIDRHGTVPKLVVATSSGTLAFDRAAVTGVTASSPFPPLPAEFKGDQIRLQLAFKYNAPAH
ncbi:MAG: energy transducer TonB [Bryobacteraceae bacterium]